MADHAAELRALSAAYRGEQQEALLAGARAIVMLQRVRDWLKYAANSPGGIVAEIDEVLK